MGLHKRRGGREGGREALGRIHARACVCGAAAGAATAALAVWFRLIELARNGLARCRETECVVPILGWEVVLLFVIHLPLFLLIANLIFA